MAGRRSGCPAGGDQRAKELILTGRWLTGTQAADYGLALRSVPLADLEAETDALLDGFRPMSPGAWGPPRQ